MTYNVTIRHTEHVAQGDGNIHSLLCEKRDGADEADVLDHVRFEGIWDGVAAIETAGATGKTLYSVDTGHQEFPSDAHMPKMGHDLKSECDFEGRLG
ncbi:MAG: hypothetical protein H7841_06875 [Magnetospirillum sp. WYHS-4]